MKEKTRVAILDDHQSIIDGYLYRLKDARDIEIAGIATFGEQLEPLLEKERVDVLIMDMSIPISETNSNPTPILYYIPKLLNQYPGMAILPISMHSERSLIRAVVESGASGYILKDDQVTIRQLGRVIATVAMGGMYFSKQAHNLLLKNNSQDSLLTARQIEVLNLFAAYPHLTSAQAALELSVAHSTVRNLLSDIYLRLGVPNRSAALAKAQKIGLIPPTMPARPSNLGGDEPGLAG